MPQVEFNEQPIYSNQRQAPVSFIKKYANRIGIKPEHYTLTLALATAVCLLLAVLIYVIFMGQLKVVSRSDSKIIRIRYKEDVTPDMRKELPDSLYNILPSKP